MKDLLEGIKIICFNCDCTSDRKMIHKETLSDIKSYLEEKGFNVFLEYSVYFSYTKRKNNIRRKRHGFLDLVARNDKIKIGIELDTGTHTKYKSVEKLIQSDFDVLIAIVRGKSEYDNLVQENEKIIKSISNPNSKEIVLILMDNELSSTVD